LNALADVCQPAAKVDVKRTVLLDELVAAVTAWRVPTSEPSVEWT